MILFSPVLFSLDRALRWCVFYAVLFSLSFCLGALVLLCFYPREISLHSSSLELAGSQKGRRPLPYELIGSGPLALKASHALGWVARLADELVVISYNSRPDIDVKQTEIFTSA